MNEGNGEIDSNNNNKEKSQVKSREKWLDDNDEWDDNEHTHIQKRAKSSGWIEFQFKI